MKGAGRSGWRSVRPRLEAFKTTVLLARTGLNIVPQPETTSTIVLSEIPSQLYKCYSIQLLSERGGEFNKKGLGGVEMGF